MQDNSVPKKRDYSGRVYKPRQCEDCPAIYVPRTSAQKRCTDCQRENTLKLKREGEKHRRQAAYVPRFCADCGTELPPPNGSARPRVRCEPCAKIHKTAHDRERNNARTESGERKAYDRRYREESRETIQANNRKYKRAHPETDAAANVRRRHRLHTLMTPEDRRLSALFRKISMRWPCFYCGAPAPADGPYELEHYFPISKFGTDHFWNLLRSCFACNRGPGGKHQMCGTAFLLKTLPPGAPWPVPPRPEGFPSLPATGPLFRLMGSAAQEPSEQAALLF